MCVWFARYTQNSFIVLNICLSKYVQYVATFGRGLLLYVENISYFCTHKYETTIKEYVEIFKLIFVTSWSMKYLHTFKVQYEELDYYYTRFWEVNYVVGLIILYLYDDHVHILFKIHIWSTIYIRRIHLA